MYTYWEAVWCDSFSCGEIIGSIKYEQRYTMTYTLQTHRHTHSWEAVRCDSFSCGEILVEGWTAVHQQLNIQTHINTDGQMISQFVHCRDCLVGDCMQECDIMQTPHKSMHFLSNSWQVLNARKLLEEKTHIQFDRLMIRGFLLCLSSVFN